MAKRYNVYGLGNALVDVQYRVEPSFLEAAGIEKGVMTLIEEDRQIELMERLSGLRAERSSGGSAANTMIGVSGFGWSATYACTVAGDEVVHGARPSPFMVYRNLDLLDVHPIQSVVKVDDTTSGVGEGLEAGCWAVGIARYSNYMEMETLEEAGTLPEDEIERRVAHTRDLLWRTGAHYVIDEPIELLGVIDDINARLAGGESP